MDGVLILTRFMASGSCWSAIRANGMSFSTEENRDEYSLRRLSFSVSGINEV